MYTVGSMFLKKQNKLQSNGRGRRRGQRKGAVGEERARQLREEQTLLWGRCTLRLLRDFLSCLQAVQDAWEKSGDQKWLDKSLCSASFITEHTLLVWDKKQISGAQPAVYTSGGSIHTGLFLRQGKGFSHGVFLRFLVIFTERINVQSKSGWANDLGARAWKGWLSAHVVSQHWALQRCITRRCPCAPSWPHPSHTLCLKAKRRGVTIQLVGVRSPNNFLPHYFQVWSWSLCNSM